MGRHRKKVALTPAMRQALINAGTQAIAEVMPPRWGKPITHILMETLAALADVREVKAKPMRRLTMKQKEPQKGIDCGNGVTYIPPVKKGRAT